MRITQGAFSFLPDLTNAQIAAQVRYAIGKGWAVSLEYTDDPHPRNTYWEMWGPPMFDLAEAAPLMRALEACREAHPEHYIRVSAFDSTHGWESVRLSFIATRPTKEPGFRLSRQETTSRNQRYTTIGYATDEPEGERYR